MIIMMVMVMMMMMIASRLGDAMYSPCILRCTLHPSQLQSLHQVSIAVALLPGNPEVH